MIQRLPIPSKFLAALAVVGILAGAVMITPAQSQSQTVATGQFEGRNKHITTGGVSIQKNGSGYTVILENDFSLDGAPAPTLGFAKRGKFDKATEFSVLKSNTGRQVYALPASIDPTQYDEFVVWCTDFSVSLGVAKLR